MFLQVKYIKRNVNIYIWHNQILYKRALSKSSRYFHEGNQYLFPISFQMWKTCSSECRAYYNVTSYQKIDISDVLGNENSMAYHTFSLEVWQHFKLFTFSSNQVPPAGLPVVFTSKSTCSLIWFCYIIRFVLLALTHCKDFTVGFINTYPCIGK